MTTSNPADLLVSEAQLLPLAEVLNLPPDRLLGVSVPALDALEKIGVRTIFDLALSRVLNAAVQINDAAANPANAMNRFGRPISDLLKPGFSGTIAVPDLRNQPIEILDGIDDPAATQAALGVRTVRDLAVYPPFRAAKEILQRAFFPEQLAEFDPESPSDLIPKTGEFPTERVQYTVLVLDQILRPDNAPPLIDLAGPNFAPIDITPVADPNFGFTTLGLGMLLTMNQSWFLQGVTLGHLLHSMALAAGESTRIAVVDWSRKTSAGQTEQIAESEDLSQEASRNRSISEVTEAVAREAQEGFSKTSGSSTTKQAGASGGGSLGPISFGASASIAKTTTSAESYATSAGSREVGASMLQQASDRTHQHAHSARTRRASVVREVSQSEHENVSTRVVTNYNHMHALTVQYYEVLQAYRTETSVVRCDRVVFVPFKLIDFSNADLLRRFRGALIDAALTPPVRDALVNFDTLELVPDRRVAFPHLGGTIAEFIALPRRESISILARRNDEGGTEPPLEPEEDPTPPTPPPTPPRPTSPATEVAGELWESAANKLSSFFGAPTLRRGSQSLFLPSDVRIEEGAVQSTLRTLQLVFVLRDGTRIVDLSRSIALAEVSTIAITGSSADADLAATGVLALSRNGVLFPLELPTVTVRRGTTQTKIVEIRASGADVNLVQHLKDNRLHYSQAVYRELDAAMIAGLLAPFSITLNGRVFPLVQVAEPTPVRIVGNALAFKINTDPVNDAEWRAFMEERGIVIGQAKVDLVPLSSGGIFAEAVLGRFNCAEKLDLSRFFNWQDSPIPIQPTEIAAVQTGTRQAAEDLKPGQFSAPLVSITPPAALPDPSGLAGTLAAVQNANLFRDLTNLAGTTQLATETGKLSAGAAASAANQATEAFKIAADLEKAKSLKDKNLTEKGAVVNKEEELKKKQQTESAGKPSAGGGTAGESGGAGGGAGSSGGGSKPASTASGATPSAPTTTGNSALDRIIGNFAGLGANAGASNASAEPTVTSEGVPLQEWDAVAGGALSVKDTENATPRSARADDIREIVTSDSWRLFDLGDARSTLLGDRQIEANSFDRLLLALALAPAGSVKTLNIIAHCFNIHRLEFFQAFDFHRHDGTMRPFRDAASESKFTRLDLSELIALITTPEIRSVNDVPVKLADVRKAFAADAEVRVFNMINSLAPEYIQALANVLGARTSGFVETAVHISGTIIAEPENDLPVVEKKIVLHRGGESITPAVEFFSNLFAQDRAILGLFTAFPRRA